VISAEFQKLSLEASDTCRFDSVTLYDGSSAKSQLLGKFCTVSTSKITSSGSVLLVVFQSDFSNGDGRFSLSWTFGSQNGQGWFIVNISVDRQSEPQRSEL